MDQQVLKLFVKKIKTADISEEDQKLFENFIAGNNSFNFYDEEKKRQQQITVYKSNNKTGNKLF